MANHQIPRTAERTERIHGLDANDDVVTLSVYKHRRAGHQHHMYFVVQYRWDGYRIDRSTRVTNQITGPDADARLEAELAISRPLFAETRERAARRAA